MKSFRILVMIGMASVSAGWLQALPRISILNGGGSSPCPPDCTATVNDAGGGVTDLFNNTGFLWGGVVITAQFTSNTVIDPTQVNNFGSGPCGEGTGQVSAFLNCSFSWNSDSHTLTGTFSGFLPAEDAFDPTEVEDSAEGVAPGQHFVIDLTNLVPVGDPTLVDDPNGTGGFSNAISVGVSPIPEPSTIGLLLSAFGGMLLARRRFRGAK